MSSGENTGKMRIHLDEVIDTNSLERIMSKSSSFNEKSNDSVRNGIDVDNLRKFAADINYNGLFEAARKRYNVVRNLPNKIESTCVLSDPIIDGYPRTCVVQFVGKNSIIKINNSKVISDIFGCEDLCVYYEDKENGIVFYEYDSWYSLRDYFVTNVGLCDIELKELLGVFGIQLAKFHSLVSSVYKGDERIPKCDIISELNKYKFLSIEYSFVSDYHFDGVVNFLNEDYFDEDEIVLLHHELCEDDVRIYDNSEKLKFDCKIINIGRSGLGNRYWDLAYFMSGLAYEYGVRKFMFEDFIESYSYESGATINYVILDKYIACVELYRSLKLSALSSIDSNPELAKEGLKRYMNFIDMLNLIEFSNHERSEFVG